MSSKRPKFQQGTYIKLSTGETYELINDDGLFIKSRNLKTVSLRTFTEKRYEKSRLTY